MGITCDLRQRLGSVEHSEWGGPCPVWKARLMLNAVCNRISWSDGLWYVKSNELWIAWVLSSQTTLLERFRPDLFFDPKNIYLRIHISLLPPQRKTNKQKRCGSYLCCSSWRLYLSFISDLSAHYMFRTLRN